MARTDRAMGFVDIGGDHRQADIGVRREKPISAGSGGNA